MAEMGGSDRSIRLLKPDELGPCRLGSAGYGDCDRPAAYQVTFERRGGTCRLRACAGHAGAFALRFDLELPAPVRVVSRDRGEIQQLRDVVAHLARGVRALRRENQALAQFLSGSRRRLPLGMNAGDHRAALFGGVREELGLENGAGRSRKRAPRHRSDA